MAEAVSSKTVSTPVKTEKKDVKTEAKATEAEKKAKDADKTDVGSELSGSEKSKKSSSGDEVKITSTAKKENLEEATKEELEEKVKTLQEKVDKLTSELDELQTEMTEKKESLEEEKAEIEAKKAEEEAKKAEKEARLEELREENMQRTLEYHRERRLYEKLLDSLLLAPYSTSSGGCSSSYSPPINDLSIVDQILSGMQQKMNAGDQLNIFELILASLFNLQSQTQQQETSSEDMLIGMLEQTVKLLEVDQSQLA